MNEIIVYSTLICPYCNAAKNLLNSLGLSYEEVRIDLDPAQRQLMMQKSGRTSVPQIFINDHHVGGFDDLYAQHQAGRLQDLLKS
jgi:glutaredoxin 3